MARRRAARGPLFPWGCPVSQVFRCVLVLVCCAGAARAAAGQAVQIAGLVVDQRTGVPLPGVRITIDGQEAMTDAQGRFALPVAAGTHQIEVSLVGYALKRETVTAAAGSAELRIRLAEGAGAFEERITVTAAGLVPDAPAAATLHGRDLQHLQGVMVADPLRAVQAMPAAASTDDFYAEFSVRGHSFDRIGLTLDGIPSKYLLHTIEQATDAGSIAMVSSETLGSATLLPGSFPQRTGRHLGAQLDLAVRDGNRAQRAFRAGISGTSAMLVGEGPVQSGRGSWLVAGRQSYLDLIVKRIDPDATFLFRFADMQGKFVYDLTPRHRVELLGVAGRTAFTENPSELASNEEASARKTGWLGGVSWRWLPGPSFTLSQTVYTTGASFANVNAAAVPLDRGTASDLGWRVDATAALQPWASLEAGADLVRHAEQTTRTRFLDGAAAAASIREVDDATTANGAYAQVRVTPASFLTITPGLRFDRWGATAESAASPWVSAEIRLGPETRVIAATGLYTQFASLSQIAGAGADLRRERARHADISVVQSLPHGMSIQVSGYRRRESDVLWQRDAEARRLADGRVILGRGDAQWTNALGGRADGVELLVRRDSPVGVAGWVGYAFGRSRYSDPATGESFWSDHDQRHSFSAYATYRLSSRGSVGAKFRYGSNYPLRGYIEETAPVGPGLLGGGGLRFHTLGEARNTLRLPVYARLDLRADRVFTPGGRRVTAFVEVANVLNRTNVRNVPSGVDRSGRVFGPTESLLPIVPSAGFTLEF